MPLTAKGEKILSEMKEQYGPEEGERVFYASANKGTITGVHDSGRKDDEKMRRAAGILFICKTGTALFLKRPMDAASAPGCWDFPGGHADDGESAEETARREAAEEVGKLPAGDLVFHTRTTSPIAGSVGVGAPSVALPGPEGAPASLDGGVDYTTFVVKVDDEFVPELNDEHTGYAWAPLESPPEPLHPGCRIALDRLSMNELGVARAIADGRLTSPQKYENVWLFAIRITGTNVAYRTKHKEFVFRKPELYLNDEFLQRVNGLPVIFRHPKKNVLDGEEFSNRVVGTVFLPYIAGDEVWAVAKIFVEPVARMMEEGNLSTSPGVNFADFSVNAKITVDGQDVLIEGNPSVIDHVAVCELGVWDKGGEPSGIRAESREDSEAMTDAEKAAADKARKDAEEKERQDKARRDAEEKAAADAKAKKDAEEKEAAEKAEKDRKDAAAGTQLEKTVTAIGDAVKGLAARFDAYDQARKDKKARKDARRKAMADAEMSPEEKEKAEKAAADKAKKDAEEKAEKDRKDAADKSAKENEDLRKQIADMASKLPKPVTDADFHAMTDAQARADSIYAALGTNGGRAPIPLANETPAIYERRVVRDLRQHSPTWKDKEVTTAYADDAMFGVIRDQVYTEAMKTAMSPATVPAGTLRMVTKREGGHQINEWVGDPRSWMDPMAGATRHYVTNINVPSNGQK